MMKRNLVICPRCREQGHLSVLGEIDEQGRLAVMRFHQGLTRIGGRDFWVVCGRCGELVYIKRKPAAGSQVFMSQQVIMGTITTEGGENQ
jgi:hypothetical protein